MCAFIIWHEEDFAGEPMGWFRCATDGRRRPGGDPTQEYIDP